MSENKGNFLLFAADYLIQQSCGGTLRLFTTKDERFKSEAFKAEAKEVYTALINSHISDPEQRLKVFDKNSVYLPTRKIGKNNPKGEEIKADNATRQEWNRTADMALITGISEKTILVIKQTQIHEKSQPVYP